MRSMRDYEAAAAKFALFAESYGYRDADVYLGPHGTGLSLTATCATCGARSISGVADYELVRQPAEAAMRLVVDRLFPGCYCVKPPPPCTGQACVPAGACA